MEEKPNPEKVGSDREDMGELVRSSSSGYVAGEDDQERDSAQEIGTDDFDAVSIPSLAQESSSLNNNNNATSSDARPRSATSTRLIKRPRPTPQPLTTSEDSDPAAERPIMKPPSKRKTVPRPKKTSSTLVDEPRRSKKRGASSSDADIEDNGASTSRVCLSPLPTIPESEVPSTSSSSSTKLKSEVPSTSSSSLKLKSEVPATSSSSLKLNKSVKKTSKRIKCLVCKKKLGLTAIKCRCGGTFCAKHRYDQEHNCTFDYRAMGADEIRRNNPLVIAEKVAKL